MSRLTVEAIHSPSQKPREVAKWLIGSAHIPDPGTFVSTLNWWILSRVNIVDEFEELLIAPLRMIEEIENEGSTFGDCDDVAMLGASILASMGAAVQFVASWPQPDGTFAHVFVRYRFPGQENYRDFDPTIANLPARYPPDVLTLDVIS